MAVGSVSLTYRALQYRAGWYSLLPLKATLDQSMKHQLQMTGTSMWWAESLQELTNRWYILSRNLTLGHIWLLGADPKPTNPSHFARSHSLHQFKLVHYNRYPVCPQRKCYVQAGTTAAVKYCLSQLFSCLQTTPSLSPRHAAMFYRESFVKEPKRTCVLPSIVRVANIPSPALQQETCPHLTTYNTPTTASKYSLISFTSVI
jgi:hypothetical protein